MAAFAAAAAFPQAPAAETLRVGGTGAALATMRELANELTARDAAFRADILPSLGSTGGLSAVAYGAIDVAVTARALKPWEAQDGLRAVACVRTPFVLVTSLPASPRVNRPDIAILFADRAAAWPDGTPVRIILRTRDETDNGQLVSSFAGMEAALERARQRPDVPIASNDQNNADLAQRIAGSLAAMTLMQVASERLNLRTIAIDRVAPSAATLADRSYPFAKTMCLVLPRRPSAAAEAFVAFAGSKEGQSVLLRFGSIPVGSEGF